MICSHCGRFVKDGSLTCEHCGTFLGKFSAQPAAGEDAVRSIRQGKGSSAPRRVADQRQFRQGIIGDYDLSSAPSEAARPNGSARPEGKERHREYYKELDSLPPRSDTLEKRKKAKKQAIRHSRLNWALILLIVAVLAVGGYVGYRIYMSKSDEGQRITARKNVLSATEDDFTLAASTSSETIVQEAQEELLTKWNEVSADAYWDVGQDYLSYGDVGAAITAFRIADIIEPDNYDGLLLLANAYELNNQEAEAEVTYLYLISTVRPDRSDAYTALISLYKSQSREQEAADLMQLGYTNTGKETFRMLRADYIPETPVVDLAAGRYELNEQGLRETRVNVNGETEVITQVVLSSPQGFDVYYTLDEDAVLPDEGILVERVLDEEGNLGYAGIDVVEGSVTIRAVSVSGSLCSDEFSASYTFYYPTPPAPYCNLAPNTYKTLHSVTLKAGTNTDDTLTRKELAERESHYEYYYTFDGSTPTTNSPKYDGTPIQLPTGRVTLKAICVNQYGKESSIMEIGYKFEAKPYLPAVYQEEDTFTGFVLNSTTLEEFTAAFGKPENQLDTNYYNLDYSATHLQYSWGYAVFLLKGTAWQLVRVEMNRTITDGPRGVRIGMTEKELTDTFRDYGQPDNADGTRGLYYSYPSVGEIELKEDGTRLVCYQLSTNASNMWRLEFTIQNGEVTKITHYYVP